MDVHTQEVAIKAAARTGTFFGLEELVEDPQERLVVAAAVKADIANNVLRLLSGESVQVSLENLNLLLAKVPMPLRPFVNDALSILNVYLQQAQIEAQLDENAVRLLKAFFKGIVEGCDLVIMKVGGTNVRMGSGGFPCIGEPVERGEATVR
jgi:hypothetical protein